MLKGLLRPPGREALKLTPGLSAGVAIGANIATAEPALISAIVIWTEVSRGVDRTRTSPGEDHHRRWRARGFGTRIELLLTRFAERFVDISRERFGHFGAPTAGFMGLERHLGCGTSRVRPPDMNEETDQHESDHEKLIKQ